MSNYIEALDRFPEKKTSFLELSYLLKGSEDMDDEQKKNLSFEQLALAFSPKACCNDDYYGYRIKGKNEDGTDFEFPNKNMVTKEALDYWRERAYITSNPLLKLRYLGLQIEFRPLIGEKASGKERFDYINAILETVETDLFDYPNVGFLHLNRAMKIATLSKNDAYVYNVKSAYFYYDTIYSKDELPGFFSQIVFLLKSYPDAFTIEEKESIENSVNDRYNRLYNSENYSCLYECVKVLIDYYGTNNRDKALNILRQFEIKIISMKNVLGSMCTQMYLHQINQHYNNYSSKADQDRVEVEISKIGPEVVDGLTLIKIPFSEDDMKVIDDANMELTTGTLIERFVKFLNVYWHHKSVDNDNAAKQKENSIIGLIHTIVYDQTGRPTTFSQSNTNVNDKAAIEFFRSTAPFMANIHHQSLLQNINDGVIDKETVVAYIERCHSFSNSNLRLVEKALDAFYAEDYIQFVHLIIPQIERACRNFVTINGENIYNNKDINGGYSFITFDGVLRKQCLERIENGDLSYHLIAVFTDSHGLNIRNDVMHGIAPLSYFSFIYADIVFHSLILTAYFLSKYYPS